MYVVLKDKKMDEEIAFLASKVFCECPQCECSNCELCFGKKRSCCNHDFSDVIRGNDRTHDVLSAPIFGTRSCDLPCLHRHRPFVGQPS